MSLVWPVGHIEEGSTGEEHGVKDGVRGAAEGFRSPAGDGGTVRC